MITENSPLLEANRSSPMNGSYNGIDDQSSISNYHCHDDPSGRLSESNKRATRILWATVALCLFFMICEVIGGILAGSLSIVTDAAHLLTDFASVLISLFSLYIARRPPSQTMSFGFHRAEVLGAFFSVFLIWIVTGVLVVLAIMRIISTDYEVEGGIMAITAALGVIVNLIMLTLLYFGGHAHSHGGGSHGHSHGNGSNINVRAALVHVLGDLLQSIGVLIAAMFIYFEPTWVIIDPICTLLFSVIVLYTTIYILRDAIIVLLEGRPSTINFSTVFASLAEIKGVKKVHDLRIWCLTMDKIALSVHLEIDIGCQSQEILRDTRRMLRENYNLHEITVQIEEYQESRTGCDKCGVPEK